MKRWQICLAIDACGNWSIHVYLLVGLAFSRLRSERAFSLQTQAHNNKVFKRPPVEAEPHRKMGDGRG